MTMDESEITAKVNPPQAPIKELQPTDSINVGENYKGWKPLYEHFNLEDIGKDDKQLEKIWEWAKKTAGTENKNMIQLELIKLSNKLGTVNIGDKPYTKILNWITDSNQLNETAQTLKDLER